MSGWENDVLGFCGAFRPISSIVLCRSGEVDREVGFENGTLLPVPTISNTGKRGGLGEASVAANPGLELRILEKLDWGELENRKLLDEGIVGPFGVSEVVEGVEDDPFKSSRVKSRSRAFIFEVGSGYRVFEKRVPDPSDDVSEPGWLE